jgi:hypothetical protein
MGQVGPQAKLPLPVLRLNDFHPEKSENHRFVRKKG